MTDRPPDCAFWVCETPQQHAARCPLGDQCSSADETEADEHAVEASMDGILAVERIDRALADLDAALARHARGDRYAIDACAECSWDRVLTAWPCRTHRLAARLRHILTERSPT